jgi:hypothetical protein
MSSSLRRSQSDPDLILPAPPVAHVPVPEPESAVPTLYLPILELLYEEPPAPSRANSRAAQIREGGATVPTVFLDLNHKRLDFDDINTTNWSHWSKVLICIEPHHDSIDPYLTPAVDLVHADHVMRNLCTRAEEGAILFKRLLEPFVNAGQMQISLHFEDC